jgi:hypothetical protein
MGPTALLALRRKCALRIFITHKKFTALGRTGTRNRESRGKHADHQTTEGGRVSSHTPVYWLYELKDRGAGLLTYFHHCVIAVFRNIRFPYATVRNCKNCQYFARPPCLIIIWYYKLRRWNKLSVAQRLYHV